MSALSDFTAELDKMFSEEDSEGPVVLLDSGYPPLNKIVSGLYAGGLPQGTLAEVFGPPASGKTLLATLLMIQAQRAGGIAIFVDHERVFNKQFAASFGLNLARPYFIYFKPDTWESGQQDAYALAEKIREKKVVPDEAPIVIVTDSIAAAVPKSTKYDAKGELRSVETLNMNDTTARARAMSAVLPIVTDVASRLRVTGIYLNQQRVKPGVLHGDPTYTPGGASPEYYSVTRLQVSTAKIMDGKEFVGREITLKCLKSKTTRPFQTTKLRLNYDEEDKAHLDFTRGMLDHLSDLGKIEKNGAWLVWDGKKYYAEPLARKLEAEGRVSELVAMLHQVDAESAAAASAVAAAA